MCFHPYSDISLPLMSEDEILSVIVEWMRQVVELSPKYQWIQVDVFMIVLLLFHTLLKKFR